MAPKHDYYTLLSGAVAGFDRDAYAARGAVYDREHKALLRWLLSPNSTLSESEIAEEQLAFRAAVRRIEFESEVAGGPAASPDRGMQDDSAAVQPEQSLPGDPEPAAQRLAAPRKANRSIFGRVMGRVLLATLLLSIGTIGWGYVSGQLRLPWLTHIVGYRASPSLTTASARALLFDGESIHPNEKYALGKAVWRSTLGAARDGQGPAAILYLDAEIPERKLALRLTMQPEVPGGAISHLIHLRFVLPDGQPDTAIDSLVSILTRTDDATGRTNLPGSIVTVAPGVFLFGLDGQPNARQAGMRQLRQMRWMDVPLRYRNGARGVLAIEIDAEGKKIINGVIAMWEQ
jgi:hypothetical protein